MSLTVDEYQKKKEETKARWKAREAEVKATMIKQAAVSASLLTGIPEWDKYLTMLQPQLELAQVGVADRVAALPTAISIDAVRKIQLEHAYLKGFADAIQFAMKLPQQVVENAHTNITQ